MVTSAMANTEWARMIEPSPIWSCGEAAGRPATAAASIGLSTSKAVTSAISVAMPMTTPGTMIAA